MRPAEQPRTCALKYNEKTSRNGSGSVHRTRRRATQQRSQQAQTTAVQSFQGALCCSKELPNWQPWRFIQEQCLVQLQKVQHPQQAAGLWAIVELSLPDRDVGTDEGAPSQHRSKHVHPERALLPGAGAGRSAPKKWRRAQRRRVRPVKQACSDTIEETISSTEARSGLQRGTTLLQHSDHVQRFFPSSHHHLHSNIVEAHYEHSEVRTAKWLGSFF